MNIEDQKRTELYNKYQNWIKKNKIRLAYFSFIYIIIILINFFFIKNSNITILFTLLLFTYIIYTYSLIWFINKKLIPKIKDIDFK